MEAALRKTSALLGKDMKVLVKNPTVLLGCLLPVGFIALYSQTMGDASGEAADAARHQFLTMALFMTVGMTGCMTALYTIAEEKEKHTLRTLMLANVGAGQILASRAIVTLAAIAVIDAVCFFVFDEPKGSLAAYLLIGTVGAVPIVLVSLLVGLASRDQMTASLYVTPVFIVAIAPMASMMSEEVANVVRFFPTGGMDELAKLSAQGTLLTGDAVLPTVVTLAWIALSLAAFVLLYKRLTRDN